METKDILKELRTSKGFSNAKEFCESAKISYNTYQNYEAGKRLPTAEILMQIADFYNVSTDYLLGRTEVREMNRLSADALSEEQVREIDDAIVSSYERLPLESRRAFIKMLEDLFGNIFDREDYGMDEYEDLAEDPQDSTA